MNHLYGGRCQKNFLIFQMIFKSAPLTFLHPTHQEKNEAITKYRNLGKVILCGDCNSRVGGFFLISSQKKNKILNLTYTMNLPRIPYQEYLRTKVSTLMIENLLRSVFHIILELPMVESMVIV